MSTDTPERAARAGGELAREHTTDALRHALVCRLFADGRSTFGHGVWKYGLSWHSGSAYFERLAPLTVARLRVEGRGDLANALSALLCGESVRCDPRVSLDEKEEDSLDRFRQFLGMLRAAGQGDKAKGVLSGRVVTLSNWVFERLRADGHHALEKAITTAFFEHTGPGPRADPLPPPRPDPDDPPEFLGVGEALAREHPADVLAHATVAALRAEEHDVTAGVVMELWVDDVVGPIAEPRFLVDAFLARLRGEGREELAGIIDALSRDAPIDRDVDDILADWQREVESPLMASGPLAAALVASLRYIKKDALADSVVALLGSPDLR